MNDEEMKDLVYKLQITLNTLAFTKDAAEQKKILEQIVKKTRELIKVVNPTVEPIYRPKGHHPGKRLTFNDWIKGTEYRKLGVRLWVEHLVFLDKYAGFGNRSELMRNLLTDHMNRKESVFIKSITRGKKIEEKTQDKAIIEG